MLKQAVVKKPKTNILPRVIENGNYLSIVNPRTLKILRNLIFYEFQPAIIQNLDVDELVEFLDRVADLYNKISATHFQIYIKKSKTDHRAYIEDLYEREMTENTSVLSSILHEEAKFVEEQTKNTKLSRFIIIIENQWMNEDTISQIEQEMMFLGARQMNIDAVQRVFVQKVYSTENVDYDEIFYAPIQHKRKNMRTWVEVGDYLHQTYAVNKYPRVKDSFFIVDVLNTSGNFDVLYDFQKTAKHKVIQKLDNMYNNKAMESVKGKASHRATAQKELESTENMIMTVSSELEEVWQFNMILDVFDTDIAGITNTTNHLKSTLLTNGMQATPILTGIDGVISSFPLCSVEKSIIQSTSHHIHSHALSKLFPAFTSDYSEEKGIIVGINEQTKNIVIVDPNNEKYPARNKLMVGLMGRGKTYATETDIVRLVAQGAKVIVLTPDRGYRFVSSIAQVVKFGVGYDSAVNSFAIDSLVVDSDDEKDQIGGELYWRKKISDVINFLHTITEISDVEIGIIEELIIKLYAKHSYTRESYTIPETVPVLSDLYELATNESDLIGFCSRIKSYAIGTYSHIFSKNREWNYDKPITVLDIKSLDEKIRPIIMDALTKSIWEYVKNYDEKLYVFIDEVHQLTHSTESIIFLTDFVKRIRKYGHNQDGAVLITQNPSDLLKHDGTEAIASLCDFLTIFPIKPQDLEYLEKIDFHPTKEQRKFLTSSQQHCAIFKAGGTSVTVKIIRLDAEKRAFLS